MTTKSHTDSPKVKENETGQTEEIDDHRIHKLDLFEALAEQKTKLAADGANLPDLPERENGEGDIAWAIGDEIARENRKNAMLYRLSMQFDQTVCEHLDEEIWHSVCQFFHRFE